MAIVPTDHPVVFISHRHEDAELAKAWQQLLRGISLGQIDPWYSSDERAGGGMQPGEWFDQLRECLRQANSILVIVTPGVVEGSWVIFESGYAVGSSIRMMVVYYYMQERHVPDVFRTQQLYNGCDPKAVMGLCQDIMHRHLGGQALPDTSVSAWKSMLEAHLASIEAEAQRTATRALFHDHFHQFDAAEGMKGKWFAKWTEIHADGREEVFEVDSLYAWTTRERIRIVGTSEKAGIDALGAAARYYPMEGVVSDARWVALSYWSGGKIPICGTVLMRPRGATGELFEGHWQGYTARHIDADPSFTRGRVVMARSRDKVEGHWSEAN